MLPTIGRIVHIVLENGFERPAIVTAAKAHKISCTVFLAHGDAENGAVSSLGLDTISRAHRTNLVSLSEVELDPYAAGKYSWHWPEREEVIREPVLKKGI